MAEPAVFSQPTNEPRDSDVQIKPTNPQAVRPDNLFGDKNKVGKPEARPKQEEAPKEEELRAEVGVNFKADDPNIPRDAGSAFIAPRTATTRVIPPYNPSQPKKEAKE